MKRSLSLLLFALALFTATAASAKTWYVRADGGGLYTPTRQSWGFSAQQIGCDGSADLSYAAAVAAAKGPTTNLHCALNDYRFLYDNQTDYNHLGWIISGGDTVILDNTKAWRVGWDTNGAQGKEPWCYGWNQGAYGCLNPTIPAGTAAQPTRILGRNYASCRVNNQPDPTKMTQLVGGHGVWNTLNLSGAKNVQVECLEITSHASCFTHGNPIPNGLACNTQTPVSDYDSDGIGTNNQTSDILLQDLWIHGHTDRGIKGPIGGTVTANRVDISVNGMAGWDFDDGNSTPNVNGTLKMSYSTIEWSGCNSIYPDVLPDYCYSQSTGGYGDGIGTPANDAMNVYMDHDIFRYNTQDGEDFGHIDSGSSTLQITNSASYGNSGGQFKWGPNFTSVLFQNNLAVANCLRMSQFIPGVPATYNKHLSDFCRANDALSFNFRNGGNAVFANNTIISYAPTTFDMQCWDSSCANTTFTLTNNIVMGYQNPTTWNMGGQVGGVGGYCGAGCNSSKAAIGTITRQNNLYYGVRGSCLAGNVSFATHGFSTGEMCMDPRFNNEPTTFASESTLDGFDFSLASGSPAQYGGVRVSNLTTDYLDAQRHDSPSIGALEFNSKASLTNLISWIAQGPTMGATVPVTSTPSPSGPSSPTSPTSPGTPNTTSPAGPAATVTVLSYTKGKNSSSPGILTVAVKAVSGAKIPTGTVTVFNSNHWALATGQLTSAGTVSWQVPSGLASQTMYGVYNGSATFSQSTSALLAGTTATK